MIKTKTKQKARLRTLTKTYGVVPESVRAVQVVCVQAVALYGSELWLDPTEVGRRDNRSHELAGPGRRISGQDHHTGQRYSSQESHAALGKRERSQSWSGGLDVVDRWIALRRWPSGIHSSVHARK